MRLNNGNCAISSIQIDMRIYTAVETKTPYFKRDYSLCDFVVQAQKKLLEISQGVFSVIFAFGELYCFAVIFRLRLSDIALRAVKGEYNITETVRFQYHFHEVKISLCAIAQNITNNLQLHRFYALIHLGR